MPIIARPRKGDDTQGLIRKFKKFLQIDDPVTIVRDRRYHKPPSVLKKERMQEIRNHKKHLKIFAKKKGGLEQAKARSMKRQAQRNTRYDKERADRGGSERSGGYRGTRE